MSAPPISSVLVPICFLQIVKAAWPWQLLQIAWSYLIFSAFGIKSHMLLKHSRWASPTRQEITTIFPYSAAISIHSTAYAFISKHWKMTYVFVKLSFIDTNDISLLPRLSKLRKYPHRRSAFLDPALVVLIPEFLLKWSKFPPNPEWTFQRFLTYWSWVVMHVSSYRVSAAYFT